MKGPLTQKNIEEAYRTFADNEHFRQIAFPRLKAIYYIKKELKDIPDLEWKFKYDHVNLPTNHISLHFTPCKGTDFSFFYKIPLVQKFEFQLYLGTSSIHFIEINNYLIEKNLLSKDQFPIKAEYRTIPHLLLNGNIKRYQIDVLSKIEEQDTFAPIIDNNILQVMQKSIKLMNPILKNIITS